MSQSPKAKVTSIGTQHNRVPKLDRSVSPDPWRSCAGFIPNPRIDWILKVEADGNLARPGPPVMRT